MKCFEIRALSGTLRAEIARLDEGWDVGVYGGTRGHVGAVTLAEPDGRIRTLEREGHRDAAVSERWAKAMGECLRAPVCVRCGIHFDGVTKRGIQEILEASDALLEQILREERMDESCFR